jgi:hypothetical protein
MEQIQISIQELPQLNPECKFCGCPECDICKYEVKKERIQRGIFVGGTGVSMIALSFTLNSGVAFIGLGLMCGTVLTLLSSLI